MRIDKFLKDSRLIKRRTVAKEACDSGRISINGKIAKAGSEVEVEDIIEMKFANSRTEIEVLQIIKNPKASDASEMYSVISNVREPQE